MTANTVLLVTTSYDDAADQVARSINQLGASTFRFDTDLFPTKITAIFDPRSGLELASSSATVHSSDIMSVWYRRNVAAALPDYVDQYDREFCLRESRSFLEGALASIQTNRWLSDPAAIWRAERKPYQLNVATQLGFDVPQTLITNDESATRRFAAGRQLIAKAVSSGYIDSPRGYRAMFTTALDPSDLDDLNGLGLAPVTFQEQIQKMSDIRVTVVGDKVFAAEIMSQAHPSSATDWRATENPELEHRVHTLTPQHEQLCLDLVKHLGLAFGAIDLALTANGMYKFFEINPNGEWLWLQCKLGFPITETIAQWLTG